MYGWGLLVAGSADICQEWNTGSKSHGRNKETLREQQEATVRPSANGKGIVCRNISGLARLSLNKGYGALWILGEEESCLAHSPDIKLFHIDHHWQVLDDIA